MQNIPMSKKPLKLFLVIFVVLMTSITVNASKSVNTNIEPIFKITILANTDPGIAAAASIIRQSLVKIGIDIDLNIIPWEGYWERLYNYHLPPYDAGGFDIAFTQRSVSDPLVPSLDWYYILHNFKCFAPTGNWMGFNDRPTEILIDDAYNELNYEKRQKIYTQVLDRIIWECHPQTGLFQDVRIYLLRDRVVNFDNKHWTYSTPNIAEMFLEEGDTFTFATPGHWKDLNPPITSPYLDSCIFSPSFWNLDDPEFNWSLNPKIVSSSFSNLYEYDSNFSLKPVLATKNPIPLNSTSQIADYIDLSTISADSPFVEANTSTIWCDNPAIDPEFDATVWESNYSMFLIPIRQGIPWHPAIAYGYNESDIFNVTVDDFLWGRYYAMHDNSSYQMKKHLQRTFGSAEIGFQKINKSLIKVNFRGGTGEGFEADWFRNLVFTAYPRHILDPNFNATAWGGELGVYPNGDMIPPISDHSTLHPMHLGMGEYIVGNGPYQILNRSNIENTVILRKFEEWGGETQSLWKEEPYVANNIDFFKYKLVDNKYSALNALENGEVDLVDAAFGLEEYYSTCGMGKGTKAIKADLHTSYGLGYNLQHPKLKNRYVRLAISHAIPRETIIDQALGSFGTSTEVVGFPLFSPFYPTDDQWENDIGLSVNPENIFKGHHEYNLTVAWQLMELAGYNMNPYRYAFNNGFTIDYPLAPILLGILSLVLLRIPRNKCKKIVR